MCPQNPASDRIAASSLRHETDEAFAWLLEISHPDAPEPYRISSDSTELYDYDDDGNPIYCTRRGGQPYFAMPFSFVPPGIPADGTAPSAKLVIAWNRDVMQGISDVHDQLTLSGVYVDVSDPDTDIAILPRMLLTSVEATGSDISATLGLDHFLDYPAGRLKCLPSITPGLFKSGVTPL